jgi:hypothetical protein
MSTAELISASAKRPARTGRRADPRAERLLDIPLALETAPLLFPVRLDAIARAFVAAGVMLRILSYALNLPLWCDEAFVSSNFIDRGYLDLIRPLDYGQICPLLFLWVELTVVKLFGFSEWTLRLFPTVCSVASVVLFAHLSGRVLRGLPRVLAVAIFAVSFYPIRYGAEVKPYSSDLLVAMALLSLAIAWWRRPGDDRWLWLLALCVPLCLALSHPAVFVAGGISLGLAGMVWRTERTAARAAFLVYNVVLVATFLGLYHLFTASQSAGAGETLRGNYWAAAFPPLRAPPRLLLWLLEAHTSHMFAYPVGGANGASTFTALLFLAGIVNLRRRRESALLTLGLAPFCLAFVASILKRYPYGGSVRTMIFLAPIICLFAGLGAAALLQRIRRPRLRRGAWLAGLFLLVAAGTGYLAIALIHPYKSIYDQRSRAFARWFWPAQGRDAELLCLKSDFGVVTNRRHWQFFRSSLYLCNQAIYSPRRRDRKLTRETISADRPLRCVLYNEPEIGKAIFDSWLSAMTTHYRLRSSTTYVVNEGVNWRGADYEDRFVVLEFVPIDRGGAQVDAGSPRASTSASTRRQSAARVSSRGSPAFAPRVSIDVR